MSDLGLNLALLRLLSKRCWWRVRESFTNGAASSALIASSDTPWPMKTCFMQEVGVSSQD